MLLWIPGLFCVGMVVVDLLWTTVAAGAGGGPLTSKLASLLWSAVPRGSSLRHHRTLQAAGIGVTLTIIGVWVLLLLLGWTLVFNASPDAVLDGDSRQPADLWSRLYYTGYTVFTLGTGDFVPGGPIWQLTTVMATFTGLSLITLAITYVLSVTSSVTQRRQLAGQIAALGKSPTTILKRAWDGTRFRGLDSQIRSLAPEVAGLAQRQLAYPVLHYFHSIERENAVAPSIAVLDELLTVLEHGVLPEQRLPELTTSQLRDTITELLRMLTNVFHDIPGDPSGDPPPIPDLEDLRRIGIPLVSDDEWQTAVAKQAVRRTMLRAFMAVDGWEWRSVWACEQDL